MVLTITICSWYQPAIDAFGHALMEEFNRLPEESDWLTRCIRGPSPTSGEDVELQPLVYVTYQAYLRRLVTH